MDFFKPRPGVMFAWDSGDQLPELRKKEAKKNKLAAKAAEVNASAEPATARPTNCLSAVFNWK